MCEFTPSTECDPPYDRQTERREMTAMVRKHILDPLALTAGIFQKERHSNIFDLSPEDTGDTLQFTVEKTRVTLRLSSFSHTGTASTHLSGIIHEVFEASSSAPAAGQGGEAAA